jgi:hypothetical protein
VGDNNFAELHLAPLTQNNPALDCPLAAIQRQRRRKFMRDAEQDLSGLLDNRKPCACWSRRLPSKGATGPPAKPRRMTWRARNWCKSRTTLTAQAKKKQFLPLQVLRAAGYLSAVMLLGRATVARQPPQAHAATVALADLHYGDTTHR